MTTRTLARSDWTEYFGAHAEELAQGHSHNVILRTEPAFRHEPREVRRLHLQSVRYEPSDELFEVVAEECRHFVLHPAAVQVDEERGHVLRLEFTFNNGASESLLLA